MPVMEARTAGGRFWARFRQAVTRDGSALMPWELSRRWWQLVVVKALLKDVPVDVFVESCGIRFAPVRDQELSCVAASGRPDGEVTDVVSGALATGQPGVHVFLRDGVEGLALFFGPGKEVGSAVDAGAGPFGDVLCGTSCAGSSSQAGQDAPTDIGAQDGVELRILGHDQSQTQLDPGEVFVARGKTAGGDQDLADVTRGDVVACEEGVVQDFVADRLPVAVRPMKSFRTLD
jgi:hypothetical protein